MASRKSRYTVPIVDPRELDIVRELFDLEIAKLHIEEQIDYRWACTKIVDGLGFKLYFVKSFFDMWLAWVDCPDRSIEYADEHPTFLASDGTEVPMGPWRMPWLHTHTSTMLASPLRCWAMTQRDALLGACALALDERARIFYMLEDAMRFVPASALRLVEDIDRLIPGTKLGADSRIKESPNLWQSDHLEVTAAKSTAEILREVASVSTSLLQPMENCFGVDVTRHMEALVAGKICLSDLPRCLQADQLERLRIVMALLLPLRHHFAQVRSVLCAVSQSESDRQESPTGM